MDWLVSSSGHLQLGQRRVRAALGKNGVIAESDKREGDGRTPLGRYILRYVMYRPDRLGTAPGCRLSSRPIEKSDGWCDAPLDCGYNRPVRLPYPASHENLWRDDELYDVVVVLGHNDMPPQSGLGSAIFLHCKRGDYEPTEGCVALDRADLLDLLSQVRIGDHLVIAED